MIRLVMLAFLGLLVSGCGRKGPLIPPEALVPAAIDDLRVVQKGEQFQVSWTGPVKEEGGSPLRDLAAFRIFRRDVLPAGEDCEKCPDAYQLIREVDLEYLHGASRLGKEFYFGDTDPVTGKTYQYKAISIRRDGTASRESNKPRKKKMVPPVEPSLHARPIPGGIGLTWDLKPLPKEMLLVGYNVYRRQSDGKFPLHPLNEMPIINFRYEDFRIERDVSYTYIVRTVASSDGQVAESGPSNEVAEKLGPPGLENDPLR